jgi:hypothetical protein
LKKLNIVVNYALSASLIEFSGAYKGDSEVAMAIKIGRFRWKIILIDSVIG